MFPSLTNFCLACGAAFVFTLVACGLLRAFALRRALVDVPNERSLHTIPVPRLGGVGIAAGVWTLLVCVGLLSRQPLARDVLTLLAGSVLIAAVGLADDLRPMSAAPRLLIQSAIVTGVVFVIASPARVVLAEGLVVALPAWVASAFWSVWIVAVLNIYNFMDGMDGLAGAQAIGAGVSVAAAAAVHGDGDLALVAALIAASSGAFFLYNVGPARLFMGDAGSTMIGFTFAALGLVADARPDPLPIPVVPLALAPFLLDGTFTIVRRASRGEPIWKAHRTHLYQRAVTAGRTHREVLTPYAGWIGVAAMGATFAARAGQGAMLALGGAMVAGLAGIWGWVRWLESRAAVSGSVSPRPPT